MPDGGGANLARLMAARGRNRDTIAAHVTPGEIVVPREIQTPEVMRALLQAFIAARKQPERFVAGHPAQSKNPNTGAPEFDGGDTGSNVQTAPAATGPYNAATFTPVASNPAPSWNTTQFGNWAPDPSSPAGIQWQGGSTPFQISPNAPDYSNVSQWLTYPGTASNVPITGLVSGTNVNTNPPLAQSPDWTQVAGQPGVYDPTQTGINAANVAQAQYAAGQGGPPWYTWAPELALAGAGVGAGLAGLGAGADVAASGGLDLASADAVVPGSFGDIGAAIAADPAPALAAPLATPAIDTGAAAAGIDTGAFDVAGGAGGLGAGGAAVGDVGGAAGGAGPAQLFIGASGDASGAGAGAATGGVDLASADAVAPGSFGGGFGSVASAPTAFTPENLAVGGGSFGSDLSGGGGLATVSTANPATGGGFLSQVANALGLGGVSGPQSWTDYAKLGLTGLGLGKDVTSGLFGGNPLSKDPGYNQLVANANQLSGQEGSLLSPLSTGHLPPQFQAVVSQATQAAKTKIKSDYANLGLTGSTSETQALQNVDQQALATTAQIAQTMFSAGMNEAQLSNNIWSSILGQNIQLDEETGQAITGLAAALSGYGSRPGTGTGTTPAAQQSPTITGVSA